MDQEQTQPDTSTQSAPLEKARELERAAQVYRCANCDIEFFWSPTVVQEKAYCCTGCAAGGPCNCDYSLYSSVTIMDVIHYGL